MQFITIVLGFLVLFSVLTYARLDRFSSETLLLNHLATVQRDERFDFNKNEALSFELFLEPTKKEDNEPQQTKKDSKETSKLPILYLEIPPHNAKLNLAKIYKENFEGFVTIQKNSFTSIFLTLLDQLYGQYAFYNDVVEPSKTILKTLLEKSSLNLNTKKIQIETLEDLACLDIEEPKLKTLFYKILRGDGCQSLLQFLCFEPNRRKFQINIHHVSHELLNAIVCNEKASYEILEMRNSLHESGKRYTKGRKKSLITTAFLTKEKVSFILKKHQISFDLIESFFDFSIAKPVLKTSTPLYASSVDARGRAKRLGKSQ